jgi:hypothetical protein
MRSDRKQLDSVPPFIAHELVKTMRQNVSID